MKRLRWSEPEDTYLARKFRQAVLRVRRQDQTRPSSAFLPTTDAPPLTAPRATRGI